MKLLRTPDERFENLPDFPFEPHYVEVDNIRIHYLDEGPPDAVEVILLLHGEPAWCFLYRHMIPPLVKAGYRCVAPDLVGFGRSDKPSQKSDFTYHKQIDWTTRWMISLDLQNLTLFCHDWGSLIGLRVAIENQDRFKRLILCNGGLPTGENFAGNLGENEQFLRWLEFNKKAPPEYPYEKVFHAGTFKKLSDEVIAAYKAPFPDDSYESAFRSMPFLIPLKPDDPEAEENKNAMEEYRQWTKPFLTLFSDSDPLTKDGDKLWQKIVPGAQGQNHATFKNARHFVQEDYGPELSAHIIEFIKNNP